MVPRSLPITCTAIVTVSAASRSGSASGHGSSATSVACQDASRVNFLGQVRHHRRDQPGQHLHRFAPRRSRDRRSSAAPLQLRANRVGKFVQPRHRDVEREAVQRLAHRGNRAVGDAAQRPRGVGRSPVGAGADPARFSDQPEHPLGEAEGARHAGLGPLHVALGRIVRQDEPARRVGAVARDDRLGIDRVALRLAHRLDAADRRPARRSSRCTALPSGCLITSSG